MYLTTITNFSVFAAIKDMASNIERKWRQMMTTDSKKTEIIIEGGFMLVRRPNTHQINKYRIYR